MRLIDADAMRADWLENGQNEYVYDTNATLDSIDEQPIVDAEPIRHGEWKNTHIGTIECSECGHGYNLVGMFVFYCPHCGAKMDGGTEDGKRSD